MLTTHEQSREDTATLMAGIGRTRTRRGAAAGDCRTERKNAALAAMAEADRCATKQAILDANAIDVANGEESGLSPAMMDRLKLTPDAHRRHGRRHPRDRRAGRSGRRGDRRMGPAERPRTSSACARRSASSA